MPEFLAPLMVKARPLLNGLSMGFLRNAVEAVASRFGYTVLANWRLDDLAQERYMKRLQELLGFDCLIDVGCNAGQFATFMRSRVGFSGPIISYEPDPEAAALARQALAGDRTWRLEQCALGRSPGTATFNIMKNSTLNSFLTPTTKDTKRIEAGNQISRSIDVEVRTLESEWRRLKAELKVERPFLKLDTQGFDLEVLGGAGDAIREMAAIETEMSVLAIYDGIADFTQSYRMIKDLGFELSGIFPSTPSLQPVLIDMDGIFVRSDLYHGINEGTRSR